MEKRKSDIKTINQCRFCLTTEESLSSIYDRSKTAKNTVTLPLQILSCVSVEVFPSDGMPSIICDSCRFFMDVCYRFKQICRSADESIMQHVQAGDELQPIPWPIKLKRIFQHAVRPSKKVKTLVSETGATIQVTASNDMSDSEDDDEDVYNIKIEGGDNPEGASIKVTKAGEELLISKKQLKPEKKGTVKNVSTGASQMKCHICDKTFTKAYYYTRHMRQAHHDVRNSARGPFGQISSFRCEQCSEEFVTQDELIYHSAKHATENLTCPLCQEKFGHVEEVSAHIKTHVEGAEFMCDLCELVFTTKDKLDAHLRARHAAELRHEQELDEDSMPMEDDEDEDASNMNVTEENGEMIVEITKTDNFLISEDKSADDSTMNTNSEESEPEASYLELQGDEEAKPPTPAPAPRAMMATIKEIPKKVATPQMATIVKKTEVIKKTPQKPAVVEKKTEKLVVKAAAPAPATADKSLRLLEKELQELQRTNSRSEPAKTPAKPEPRGRRPQPYTSTPKPTRFIEEKKAQASAKTPVVEKKAPEKRTPVTKENKEPKEAKGNNNNTTREEKDTPKSVKNGSERNSVDENVRRSNRTSKVQDYAKMIKTQESSDDSDDENDEEYKEAEPKVTEQRGRPRKVVGKPPVKPQAASPKEEPAAAPPARKRGRPRKDQKEVPTKVRKSTNDDDDKSEESDQKNVKEEPKKIVKEVAKEVKEVVKEEPPAEEEKEKEKASPSPAGGVLVSPSGPLKKVPVKSLPPGVKALPLPGNARPVNAGEVCEMQIGKKVVKVQKIVMTKAEVEAMAKKGLVEMKDGTMVLKQGIKLPTADMAALKSSLVGNETTKKPLPSRCDLGDDT